MKKTIKGFTILELIVVVVVLGIFASIAYPNVSNWITDREVKNKAYEFLEELNDIKSKVSSGEYAMAMVHFTTPNFENAYMKIYYMTPEQYNYNYRGDTYKSGNNIGTCDYDPRNMNYTSAGFYTSTDIRHWPNVHMCISKNGSKKGILNQKNPETGQTRSLSRVVFCAKSNSTTSGSSRCNTSNKIEHRYMLTWDIQANFTLYRYNVGKNQWCTENQCRAAKEFNL